MWSLTFWFSTYQLEVWKQQFWVGLFQKKRKFKCPEWKSGMERLHQEMGESAFKSRWPRPRLQSLNHYEYWVGQKSSSGLFCKMLWKTPNKLFGQVNALWVFVEDLLWIHHGKHQWIRHKRPLPHCVSTGRMSVDGKIETNEQKIISKVRSFKFCGKNINQLRSKGSG